MAERYELDGLALETPGFLPFDHGFHHEFFLLPMNRWAGWLLGLCFSEGTIAAAEARGIDAERLRWQACAALDAFFARPEPVPDRVAAEWWIADLIADPEWAVFLSWRCQLVADLVAEVRAALPKETKLAVIPTVQRPSAAAWSEGSDLRLLAEAADTLEVPAYEASAAAVALDAGDVRRRAGAGARISYILRPAHPDLAERRGDRGGRPRAEGGRALRHRVLQLRPCRARRPGARARGARRAGGGAMMRYLGKAALVTGGGGGIGGAIAERLAFEGAAVGVLDRRGEAAAQVAARIEGGGGKACALTAEITDPDSVAAALTTMTETLGAPDVLVNNAAWALKGDLESTALADWRAEIEIDLDGQFVCAKAVLPGMVARGAGAIVNIGSVNGLMALGNPAYSAAKAGLLSFTRSLAVEYGPRASAPTWSRPARWRRTSRPGASGARRTRRFSSSSPAGIPWAGSAGPRTSPQPWPSSRPTRRPSSTAPTWWSTAALRPGSR